MAITKLLHISIIRIWCFFKPSHVFFHWQQWVKTSNLIVILFIYIYIRVYTSHTSDYILMIFPYLLVRSHMFFCKDNIPTTVSPYVLGKSPWITKKKNFKSHKSPHKSPFREGFEKNPHPNLVTIISTYINYSHIDHIVLVVTSYYHPEYTVPPFKKILWVTPSVTSDFLD